MNNYLIVTDTTSAMNLEIAKKHDIALVPLSVVINGKEFKDLIEITNDVLYEKLREGLVPTTSQPSVGYVTELMEKWKTENYDAIIVLTCSSDLSGTNHTFHMVKKQLEMDNVYIVDTRSVGAPIMDGAIRAKEMANEGKDIIEILKMLDMKYQNQFSFLYPETLTQLKKGGRVSPLAANMASLLKIKPLLYLKEDGSVVDRFGMARTEGKVIQLCVDKFRDLNVNSLTNKLYILHADNAKGALQAEKMLKAVFDDIECEINELPSVLTCHGGLGCVAIQSTLKI
ncbi:DegV family protein with EDD domain [Breznakia sp. PF5-3]|uniref:DegV family protein n=1 Tax=unclassified Breznakia TaxID=2623764 RepID=UPI0024059DDF|nr:MULTISPECIES: DegV family protein [unclassified Breznakia]MDL2276800.1 DegV family protein [Breznakia sp. OttesenSCG-928-G09]MDF9825121.1 DegV family protein with EDD domain [Breznakia sp. PM6-1]MDF9835968.1 DegV family protein with EDD domain [Breznakia sp. PF5-3]MDF9837793.1 DegV family protein with EDD domain [Breznakia sp. PFB2-8]MDF9859713.1 DegV family protein with EDD domain [Breznakia sp. PH5-24]